jgi:hypothetical protein
VTEVWEFFPHESDCADDKTQELDERASSDELELSTLEEGRDCERQHGTTARLLGDDESDTIIVGSTE